MKTNEWFKGLLESFEDTFDFRLEGLILNITEKICKNMKLKNINRTKLAERLNVSSPAVTKILNGNSNFTLKTLLSLADALDLDLIVDFKEQNEYVASCSTATYLSITDESYFVGFNANSAFVNETLDVVASSTPYPKIKATLSLAA